MKVLEHAKCVICQSNFHKSSTVTQVFSTELQCPGPYKEIIICPICFLEPPTVWHARIWCNICAPQVPQFKWNFLQIYEEWQQLMQAGKRTIGWKYRNSSPKPTCGSVQTHMPKSDFLPINMFWVKQNSVKDITLFFIIDSILILIFFFYEEINVEVMIHLRLINDELLLYIINWKEVL